MLLPAGVHHSQARRVPGQQDHAEQGVGQPEDRGAVLRCAQSISVPCTMSCSAALLRCGWRMDAVQCTGARRGRGLAVQVLWSSVAEEAYGSEKGLLAGLKIRSLKGDTVRTLHGGPCPRTHLLRLKHPCCIRCSSCYCAGNHVLGQPNTCGCHAGYVQVTDLPVSGLFFAIGHEPATKFLDGQLKLDGEKYIVTEPGAYRTHMQAWLGLYNETLVVICS
jgi:hypothetical protein